MGWDADDARDAAQAASWSERRAALAEAAEWEADEHPEWVGTMGRQKAEIETLRAASSGAQASRDEWIRRFARMRKERDEAVAAIDRVRKLHHQWPNDPSCAECVELDGTPSPYPCATLRALDE